MRNIKKTILPIILARGGSKSIPRKNIKLLNGKPLLSYVLTEALKVFSKVYVSTEDSEIAKVAKRYGATIIERPHNLALDASKSIDAVKHALEYLKLCDEPNFAYVLLLNACTPMIIDTDLRNVLKIAQKTKCGSITSVVEDTTVHLSKLCYIVNNKIVPVGTEFKTGERQKLKPIYKRNAALYFSSVAAINRGSFFSKNCYGYVMSAEKSHDVNSMWDFLVCEAILKYKCHEKMQSL